MSKWIGFVQFYAQIDQHIGATPPRRRVILVPSLASIEEMRTPAFESLKEENNVEKILLQEFPLNRAPFAEVN